MPEIYYLKNWISMNWLWFFQFFYYWIIFLDFWIIFWVERPYCYRLKVQVAAAQMIAYFWPINVHFKRWYLSNMKINLKLIWMHQCNWFKSKESESQCNFVLWIESNLNEVHYECFITVMISYDLIVSIFHDCNF